MKSGNVKDEKNNPKNRDKTLNREKEKGHTLGPKKDHGKDEAINIEQGDISKA
jgi:hypothetical protein